MLNALRQSASGIFAKILLLLLVLSFALWGIGDIFTKSSRDVTLAKIGNTRISLAEYETTLNRRVKELRSMMGDMYSPQLMQSLNINLQVLYGMVDDILIRKETGQLGIRVSDEAVMESIRANPAFQGGGKFDIALFQQALQTARWSEKQYYEGLRSEIAARLVLSTLSQGRIYPQELEAMLYEHAGEQRTADVIVISADSIDAETPDDAEINAYYEEHKDRFLAPEYRTLRFIDLNYAQIAKTVEVPAEDIRMAYEERIQEFRKPETRELEQLLYETEDDAAKAHEMLTGGKKLAEVAKKVPPSNPGNLHIGTLKKTEVLAEAADTVFALQAGAFTKPFKSDFGWHIFQVTKIHPETTTSLSDAREMLVKDLSQKTAEDAVYKLANALEDSLAAGTLLENAAKELDLTVTTVQTPVDAQGNDADGKKVTGIPAYTNFLGTAFATAEKAESSVTLADEGSYFVVRVEKVTPQHTKKLDDVRQQVVDAWKAQTRASKAKKGAIAIAEALDKGKSAAEAIAVSRVSAQIKSSGKVNRQANAGGAGNTLPKDLSLPPEFMKELFALKPGKATHAHGTQNGGFVVGVVKQILPLDAEHEEKNTETDAAKTALRTALGKQYENELYQQYMTYLRQKYEVEVFEESLPRMKQSDYEQ